MAPILAGCHRPQPATVKKGAMEHPQVFDHVGLLCNEPPGTAELPLI